MLNRLSARAEFWIIVLMAYGYPVGVGVFEYVTTPPVTKVVISDTDLGFTLGYELGVGLLAVLLLRARGRAWSEFRPIVTWLETFRGLALFLVATFVVWFAYGMAAQLPSGEDRLAPIPFEGKVTPLLAVVVSLVNPFFEECFALSYVQERLREHGAAIAIGAALLLRLLTHLYQGPHAVVGVLPISLLFGVFYWRTGRIWPVLVAHAIMDAIGLLTLQG